MNKLKKNNKLIIGIVSTIILLVATIVLLNGLKVSALNIIGNSEMEAILADNSGQGTFVYVGRPTCPACQEFEPILQGVLDNLGKELPYYEADLAGSSDANRRSEIFEQLGVASVPVIVYIENGRVIDALTGVQREEAIRDFFNANGGLR